MLIQAQPELFKHVRVRHQGWAAEKQEKLVNVCLLLIVCQRICQRLCGWPKFNPIHINSTKQAHF